MHHTKYIRSYLKTLGFPTYQKTLYRLANDFTINRILISAHKIDKYGSLRDKKCYSKDFRIGEKMHPLPTYE